MSFYGSEKHILTILLEGITKTNNVLQDKLAKNGSNSKLGPINMGNNHVNNVSNPTANGDGATKIYADNQFLSRIPKTGDTIQGGLVMSNNKINGLGDPLTLQDCSTRSYIDALGLPSFTIITGIMPNAVNAEIYLCNLPTDRSINNGKVWAISLWMERSPEAGEWYISSSPAFKSLWTDFTLYSRDNLIMAYFTGVP